MKLTREAAERAMTAFAVVAARGNHREAEDCCRKFLIACIGQLPREKAMSTEATPTGTTPKFHASKENAVEAQRILNSLTPTDGVRTLSAEDFEFLSKFVVAAHKRLPTQQAIDKDTKRKRDYHTNRRKTAVPA